MATPEVTVYVNLDGVDQVTSGFQRIGESAANMGTRTNTSFTSMAWDYRTLAFNISGLGLHALSLSNTMEQLRKGQIDSGEAAMRFGINLLGVSGHVAMLARSLSQLEAASWLVTAAENARAVAHSLADAAQLGFLKIASTVVGWLTAIQVSSWQVTIAEHARGIAHTIANALSGPAGWAILAGAAAAAGIGIGLVASIPSRQYGGFIEKTGPYLLHAGEFVVPAGSKTSNITINIYGVTSPRETADAVVDRLRRAGLV